MEYNPPGKAENPQDFALIDWQREIFKGAWKITQAKHIFPILTLIAFSDGINFNALKDSLGNIRSQSLTNQLKQLQELKLVARNVEPNPPLSVTYELTEFGLDYCLMSIPFFVFFTLKPYWDVICQRYDEDPPKLTLLDGTRFPNLQKKFTSFQSIKQDEKSRVKDNILLSSLRERAIQLIYTTLDMTRDLLSKLKPATPNPANRARVRDMFKQAIVTLQGKFLFDITYVLYNCASLSFNDIKRLLPGINSLTLSTRLKELEHDGILTRKVESETPLRVSYNLTSFGTRLLCTFWPLIAIIGIHQII